MDPLWKQEQLERRLTHAASFDDLLPDYNNLQEKLNSLSLNKVNNILTTITL